MLRAHTRRHVMSHMHHTHTSHASGVELSHTAPLTTHHHADTTDQPRLCIAPRVLICLCYTTEYIASTSRPPTHSSRVKSSHDLTRLATHSSCAISTSDATSCGPRTASRCEGPPSGLAAPRLAAPRLPPPRVVDALAPGSPCDGHPCDSHPCDSHPCDSHPCNSHHPCSHHPCRSSARQCGAAHLQTW